MSRSTEIRLGQRLVQKRLCSLRQINEALLRQKSLRERNQKIPLGRILVEAGWLEEEALRETLAELGALTLSCPQCETEYSVRAYVRNSPPTCKRCGGALQLLDPDAAERSPEPREPTPGASPGDSTLIRPIATAPARGQVSPQPPETLDATGDDEFIGKVLGGCQLLERIGRGGMGVVYKAKQLNLGRTVAVKILASDLASDEGFVRRFVQEARSAALLNHPNIVHINDVGEFQGVFYFVMEYVDGQNLRELLKTVKKLDVPRAVDIAVQVCHALRHAHSRGIIHRDIKPENIMLTQEGSVKLADLGLAKRVASENSASLTHAGAILGTPYYMAPEQAKDFRHVDRRSDIYSLGVTLYRMLTGRVPFDGRSPIEVMIKAIDGKKVPVREWNPEVPPELEAVVDRMMHKNPDQRYQDVEEVLRALVPFMNPQVELVRG